MYIKLFDFAYALIGAGRNLAGDHERVGLLEAFEERVVKAEERDVVLRGHKVHDGSCRETGDDESYVNLVVLEAARCGCEVEEVGLGEVLVGKLGLFEESLYVAFNAGSRCAYADSFALKVRKFLNSGVLRNDDLNVLGIESADRAEVLKGFALEHELSVVCPVSDVCLCEGELKALRGDEVYVGYGSVACLSRYLKLAGLGDRVGDCSAYRVVGACRAACRYRHKVSCRGDGGEGKCCHYCNECYDDDFLHYCFLTKIYYSVLTAG